MTIEQLLEENKDVLIRLKTCGPEYYTAEQMRQSLHIQEDNDEGAN
jgi:hypothetical protein